MCFHTEECDLQIKRKNIDTANDQQTTQENVKPHELRMKIRITKKRKKLILFYEKNFFIWINDKFKQLLFEEFVFSFFFSFFGWKYFLLLFRRQRSSEWNLYEWIACVLVRPQQQTQRKEPKIIIFFFRFQFDKLQKKNK